MSEKVSLAKLLSGVLDSAVAGWLAAGMCCGATPAPARARQAGDGELLFPSEGFMLREFLESKIHRATVTDANLNYVGSITIDEELMQAAKMREWQKVEILDINNGERFQTYIIKGKPGSGVICLNGAAARKVQKGDKVIIVTYAILNEEEIKNYKPNIVIVDDNNKIIR